MINHLFNSTNGILARRQTTILSAATIVMVMIAASRLLGLVRNRVLAHFFTAEILSTYFAAFRLPDIIFEVMVYGALSSAFIPIFTSYISKEKKDEAWHIAIASLNLGMAIFAFLALLIFLFAYPVYRLIAPGYSPEQISQIVQLTRILLLAQGFFVASYFLTSVLESLGRFLVPALAPVFYNLGIIAFTVLFAPSLGILAPTLGAVLGAFLHFIVQLPLAHHLGFRWHHRIDTRHPGVRSIGRLALPRLVELSFLQLGKSAELYLASLVSTAAYTYFTFANSLQLVPIGLFGTSLAKASLPMMAAQIAQNHRHEFQSSLKTLFGQILFLVVPCSVFLVVLRVPVIRLVFGANQFTWESTLQTGYTLSAFALGMFSQALVYLLTRAYYALQDTNTPVKISIATIFLNIALGALFILWLHLPVWSLALAFSLASVTQCFILLLALFVRLPELDRFAFAKVFLKIIIAAAAAGTTMFVLLKVLDKSVWSKQLSFLGKIGIGLPTDFERFVLDTRYTFNLLLLTLFVSLVGFATYLGMAWLLRLEEISILVKLFHRVKQLRFFKPRRTPFTKEPLTIVQDQT